MMTPLETRLFELQLPLPEGLVERAMAAASTAPAVRPFRINAAGRLVLAGTLLLAVLLGANAAVSRLWPDYGRVLAEVPGAGIIPWWVDERSGLRPRELTPLNVAATSAGHEVRLVGGSADAVRTLLFFEIDGKSFTDDHDTPRYQVGRATISDVEGNTYAQVGHNLIPVFAPLQGAAAAGGPLTLHITELRHLDDPPFDDVVVGEWTIDFSLVASPALNVTTPAPVTASGTTYEISSIRASRDVLAFHWRATGVAVAQFAELVEPPPGSVKPLPQGADTPEFRAYMERMHAFQRGHFDVTLTAPSGNTLRPFNSSGDSPADGAVEGDVTVVLERAGRYFIHFGTAAEMVIEIP